MSDGSHRAAHLTWAVLPVSCWLGSSGSGFWPYTFGFFDSLILVSRIALAVASVAPPPFPFTPLIAAASAFQYPRRRLLSVVAAARGLRFFVLGMAAYWTGREVLRIMQASWFKWAVTVIVMFGMIASSIAVIRFFRKR